MSSEDCQGKSSWPELVGVNGETAAATIERENPSVNAIIVKEGSAVIQNFDCNRVWVWVNKKGIVISVPKTG
ncbi:inhibitor of trypsin and hageman factor [Cornus florida]|uniref:inhibitor of trypsin and hageman factor n=1 Tax=Cornus florida TaxID=4283 RepID=UPI00289B88F5|nr:inhibitor of trypsin and hageman factor [Cornus florida]